ncbi:MAG: sodium:proton antiporter [Gammaproteobacteria bacterium]|nr:sodium:proton antiporter [Gammaproteobacteria bacterium]
MDHHSVIFILLLFLCFGLVSKRIAGTPVTPPMLFAGGGLLLGEMFFGAVHFPVEHMHAGGDGGWMLILLEATLVLVLFSDAARINLRRLINDHIVPQRMLLFGMPLGIALGGALAYVLPLGLSPFEGMLLAAILTPTDAALGQAVLNDEKVPERIRRSVNVESGLNDGIALPVILIIASVASAMASHEMTNWVHFAALQLVFGPAVGIAVGYAGAKLLSRADAHGWMSEEGEGIFSLVLAGICFLAAEALQGNGFIAAFLGGLVFGNKLERPCKYLFEFVETEGQILTLGSFFIFGALLLPPALAAFNPWHWLYGALSLTVLRMLPIALSLAGLHLKMQTKLFLGWFGPRGLASVLFVLLVISKTELTHAETLVDIVFITVLLSIFLHGLSAAPLAKLYGAAAAEFHGYEEHRKRGERFLRTREVRGKVRAKSR